MGEPQLTIRRLSDSEEARVCARLMAESEPWITLGRTFEDSLAILQNPSREVSVALGADQAIVGFIIVAMQGPFPGYIQTVCVHPEHRGHGLGSRLVRFAEERIFRESPNVFLCVSSFNPEARRLYERLGYGTVGVLTDYIVDGFDEILMRKTRGSWARFRDHSGSSSTTHPSSRAARRG